MYVKIVTPVGKMDLHMSLENTRKLLNFACSAALPEKDMEETETVKKSKTEEKDVSPEVEAQTEPVPEEEPRKIMQKKAGHRGFLLIKCQECGEIKGFCKKEPITEYRCPCGAVTPLGEELTAAYLRCQCGSNWKYRTNITDEVIEYNCLNCGCPVDLAYNKKKGIYETM